MTHFENALLFKCIVEQGSVSKAATQFNMTPSAASKRLNKLERSLGTVLIKRTTRSLSVTESGEYFYEKVRFLQHEWQNAIDETNSFNATVKGKLIIASPQPLASRFLMPAVAAFHQQFPLIDLEMIHSQLDQLPSMQADVSISRELAHYDSNTMLIRPFFTYQNSLFASPDYLASHAPIDSIEDLHQHDCLCYEHTQSWHFSSQSVELCNKVVTNSAEIMISAAKQGMGIAYLPEVILTEEINSGALIPVLNAYHSQHYRTCLYHMKMPYIPKKTRLFIDFLCSHFEQYN